MTASTPADPTPAPAEPEDGTVEDVYVFPVSFAQQRLWFFQQMYPESAAYNMPLAMWLRGRLHVNHLEDALNEITRRHEALRTSIDLLDGQPAQLISPGLTVSVPVTDLSGLPAEEREAEARRLAAEEVRRAFDLRTGPLLRVRLLRFAEDEHVLVLVVHHIVCDGWSIDLLFHELAVLYAAYAAGESSPLDEPPVQYADYAVWQREWLSGEVLKEQLDYWRGQLEGAPALLELPTDRPRPQVRSLNGSFVPFELPGALASKLRRLCQREGVTLFMLLLGAYQLLLSRYCGQTDVLVGTPIAGRNRQEVEGLIGFFVNTLILRTDLSGGPSLRELLRRVREVCLGAYAHAELPLEKLVEELQPERSLSHSPLFQVMFALQNTPSNEVEQMPGLEVRPVATDATTAAFDLTLNVEEEGEDILGRLRYNTDLFDAETIRRMVGHYLLVLEAAAENLDQSVLDVPLLGRAERRQILRDWNESKRDFPADAYVHELFEREAARGPERTALVFDGRHVSYAELNRRANRLAHHLRRSGVGPEQTVAVCFKRSVEMLVAILGVLKAGGAYAPLDPAAPPERLGFMLAETGAAVVLTQQGLAHLFQSKQGLAVLSLDADRPAVEESGGDDDDNPARAVSPDNLAYVLYTSGSTGRPKGVMVSHRNLSNSILAQLASLREPVGSTLLLMSYFFDGSLFNIFCPLCQGATLVVPRDGQQADPSAVLGLIAGHGIRHIFTVPSFYSLLLEQARPEHLESVRVVHVGGETCTPQLVGRHRQLLPQADFFNEYGPTETTVWCTQYLCPPPSGESFVPAGRPTANAEVYLLDERLQPVPVGVPGQIYVGGLGVARGYLKHPGLTAEKFIPHPFADEPGQRLYRTGDLARFLPDGNVVFLGRMDRQVKLRGYRIELGEIEVELSGHEAVRRAAVVEREDASGDRRLVAYVVADPERVPASQTLRDHLKSRLPEYMIPAAFVFLDALPLTRNGKLDRHALPPPDGARPGPSGDYVAPGTKLERALAEVWREVLGVERVGSRDNFFELGGDSLRAALLINRLTEWLGDFVYVVALFEAPTVASLAEYLTAHYPEAVARAVGVDEVETKTTGGGRGELPRAVNASALARVRELVGAASFTSTPAAKNPPAVFILSPPRSGSTLLRVMMAGHPALFAPPELELLSFDTLAERRAALAGKYSFWLEGTIRAVMEIKGCRMEEARRLMEECEARNLSVPEFYGLMQEWIGGRTLVDKTPSYALDREVLRRAEDCFDGALYVHLLRHPFGMIRSFEEAKLEQVFFRHEHPFSRRELAELIWLVSQQNIREFLTEVPARRRYQLRFEELVSRPVETLEGLCDFLGLEFHPEMAEPYRQKEQRMTDGIHPLSQMLGDVKFHQHTRVDAGVAERWKAQAADDPLSEMTWAAAEDLGYQREKAESARAGAAPVLVPIQPKGSAAPFFCVHPVGGGVFCYRDLARRLGDGQPFYGLQARDLAGASEPHTDVEATAAEYVEALRAVQPGGPYRLGGWSLGGVIAFEMAQQLRRRGEHVSLLALIDSLAPRAMELSRRQDVVEVLDELCRTGTDEQLKEAFAEARRDGFLPPEVGLGDFRRWLGGCRVRIEAARDYRPSPFAGRVVLFKTEAPEHHKPAPGEESFDPDLGWGELAAGGLDVHPIGGEHQRVILEPHVAGLAELLKRYLT
ncbi:MAG TPA: amino acid adenylation domain-containing protein [Pyrinomonadaceae bacterium]|jgi:amino acid adenylation domain-containing protein|nr:amino acid adenylation domain-containing protein [Pyrinomonadaceae bacterium]